MSDTTIRLRLQEDVNTKLTKITTTAREVGSAAGAMVLGKIKDFASDAVELGKGLLP